MVIVVGTSAHAMASNSQATVAVRVLVSAPVKSVTGRELPAQSVTNRSAMRADHRIDTSSMENVAHAYASRWVPAQATPGDWTGTVNGCEAGKVSTAAQDATFSAINFARAMAGLDAVAPDTRLSERAQKTALVMAANRNVSHTPPPSWSCWSDTSAEGAGSSLLALSIPAITAGGAIDLYLDDEGSTNLPVAHRRWLLYPTARTMGVGLTSITSAVDVLGPRNKAATNPNWVAWPTAGWFPSQMEPNGRWSLSSGEAGANFSQAKIRVTQGGKSLAVRKLSVKRGYGMPTVVFNVKGASQAGTYKVAVTGIRGAASKSHTYKVKLFDA